jgi:hypothetical protein
MVVGEWTHFGLSCLQIRLGGFIPVVDEEFTDHTAGLSAAFKHISSERTGTNLPKSLQC